MLAWHFIRSDRRLGYGDGRLVVDGETLAHGGELSLCKRGLHASEDILDALSYAPGPVLCRVVLSGDIVRDRDKAVASRRTCLWSMDLTEILDAWKRWCALQVIHLWDAPPVVIQFLRTGDARLRAAARNAAQAATWDAAWGAAWAAARNAAWDAARDVAWTAARAAAQAATQAATRAAAWTAAWDAAWDAARDAERNRQRAKLLELIEDAMPPEKKEQRDAR